MKEEKEFPDEVYALWDKIKSNYEFNGNLEPIPKCRGEELKNILKLQHELMMLLTKNTTKLLKYKWEYFISPLCCIGGHGKSRYEIFVRNCNPKDVSEIFMHPHFVKYLHYFIEDVNIQEVIKEGIQKYLKYGVNDFNGSDPYLLYKDIQQVTTKNKIKRNKQFRDTIMKYLLQQGLPPEKVLSVVEGLNK